MRDARARLRLERIGLWAANRPALALALIAVISLLAAAGLPRVGFNSEIREIFRAEDVSQENLDRIAETFGAADNDLHVVVEGDALFTARGLAAFRDFALDAQLASGVRAAVSMFSARTAPDRAGQSRSLFPLDLGEPGDLADLRRAVAEHPLVAGKFLSRDGTAALLLLTLSPDATGLEATGRTLDELARIAQTTLAPAGLHYAVTGFPAIRATIIGILISDQLVFRVAAIVLSILLASVYFLNWRYVVLAVLPAGLSVLWLLGAMGWSGQTITVVTNVVPSLVMVIAFSNAIHLLLAVRRERMAGLDASDAVRQAVIAVGPATMMTALTTAVALATLTIVDRPAIASFGLVAAFGALAACAIVLLLVPGALAPLAGAGGRAGRKAAGHTRAVGPGKPRQRRDRAPGDGQAGAAGGRLDCAAGALWHALRPQRAAVPLQRQPADRFTGRRRRAHPRREAVRLGRFRGPGHPAPGRAGPVGADTGDRGSGARGAARAAAIPRRVVARRGCPLVSQPGPRHARADRGDAGRPAPASSRA